MKYATPEIELLAFEAQDVIMLSDDEELEKDTIAIEDLVIRSDDPPVTAQKITQKGMSPKNN